jgi:hypothetical protein
MNISQGIQSPIINNISKIRLTYFQSKALDPPDKLIVNDKNYDIVPGLQITIDKDSKFQVQSADPNSYRVFTKQTVVDGAVGMVVKTAVDKGFFNGGDGENEDDRWFHRKYKNNPLEWIIIGSIFISSKVFFKVPYNFYINIERNEILNSDIDKLGPLTIISYFVNIFRNILVLPYGVIRRYFFHDPYLCSNIPIPPYFSDLCKPKLWFDFLGKGFQEPDPVFNIGMIPLLGYLVEHTRLIPKLLSNGELHPAIKLFTYFINNIFIDRELDNNILLLAYNTERSISKTKLAYLVPNLLLSSLVLIYSYNRRNRNSKKTINYKVNPGIRSIIFILTFILGQFLIYFGVSTPVETSNSILLIISLLNYKTIIDRKSISNILFSSFKVTIKNYMFLIVNELYKKTNLTNKIQKYITQNIDVNLRKNYIFIISFAITILGKFIGVTGALHLLHPLILIFWELERLGDLGGTFEDKLEEYNALIILISKLTSLPLSETVSAEYLTGYRLNKLEEVIIVLLVYGLVVIFPKLVIYLPDPD